MNEVWNFLLNFAGNTSIGDVVIVALLLTIKFNDIRHLEKHIRRLDMHNEIEDSRKVAGGAMTKAEYYYAHDGKEPREI